MHAPVGILFVYALDPRRGIEIEHLSTRMGAGNILVKIATASFAKDVGVIRGRANGYGPRRSAEQIAQVMRDVLQLVRTKFHLIDQDYIMGGFRLGSWLACISGGGRCHLPFLVVRRGPVGRSHAPSPW